MADTVNILQLTEVTNPSGHMLYAVKEGDPDPDRKISYENLVQALYNAGYVRAASGQAASGSAEDISFSTAFDTANYSLIFNDYNGIGIQLISKSADKFRIQALSAGVFDWIAIFIPA